MIDLYIRAYENNAITGAYTPVVILSAGDDLMFMADLSEDALHYLKNRDPLMAISIVIENNHTSDSYRQFIDTVEYGCSGIYIDNEYEVIPDLQKYILGLDKSLNS